MNPNPEISIITINYNGVQDTKELIDSLQAHLKSCNHEVIVVDNGSEQNEADLLAREYPEIKIVRSQRNLGFAGGNNVGIAIARGKYILLLNNDTYVTDESLFFLKQRLEMSPQAGAASPKIKFAAPPQNIQFAGFTPMSSITMRNRAIGYNVADTGQYDQAAQTAYLHGAALMVKKEVIEKIGLMPEIYFLYYEEMDWCQKISHQGYELWYEPRCTVYHKESRSTGSDSPLKTYYLCRNRLLFTWRNTGGFSSFMSILYQLSLANPKNIIVNLLKAKMPQAKAILKGCKDFFLLKDKRK